MVGNLPFELQKYSRHRRYLKKLLNNTKSTLQDIYRSGYFISHEQMMELNLRIEDEDKIRDIIENPVGIVILGSKSWAKAAIVNELLGYALLPVCDLNDDSNNHGHGFSYNNNHNNSTRGDQSSGGKNSFASCQVNTNSNNLSTNCKSHTVPSSLNSSTAMSSSLSCDGDQSDHGGVGCHDRVNFSCKGSTVGSTTPNITVNGCHECSDGNSSSNVSSGAHGMSHSSCSSGGYNKEQTASISPSINHSHPSTDTGGGGTSSDNWRAIRLKYGSSPQVSLAVSNQYELVEHLSLYDQMCVPRSELNLNLWKESQSPNDPGYCSATLEIKLPHHLLAEDTQIIVAPTLSTGRVNFETIYNTCFDGVSPVVIYALSDCDSLSAQEVDDLMELQRLAPKVPVFFIRTSRPTNPAANDCHNNNSHNHNHNHNNNNNNNNISKKKNNGNHNHNHNHNTSQFDEAKNAYGYKDAPETLDGQSEKLTVNTANNICHSKEDPCNSKEKVTSSLWPTPPSSCTSPSPENIINESERKLHLHYSDAQVMKSEAVTSREGMATLYDIPRSTTCSSNNSKQFDNSITLFQQLTALGFLNPIRAGTSSLGPSSAATAGGMISSSSSNSLDSPGTMRRIKRSKLKDGLVSSELVENFDNFPSIIPFIRQVLQSHLVRAANTLNALCCRCLRVFILTAFDMTRDMLITPKRINYAKEQEFKLYESLMAIANRKQEEIRQMISDTLNGMRTDLLREVAYYQFKCTSPSGKSNPMTVMEMPTASPMNKSGYNTGWIFPSQSSSVKYKSSTSIMSGGGGGNNSGSSSGIGIAIATSDSNVSSFGGGGGEGANQRTSPFSLFADQRTRDAGSTRSRSPGTRNSSSSSVAVKVDSGSSSHGKNSASSANESTVDSPSDSSAGPSFMSTNSTKHATASTAFCYSSGSSASPADSRDAFRPVSPREYQACLNEIQDFVLSQLNAAIAGKLIGSVDCLRDTYVGTLERCLQSLERGIFEGVNSTSTSSSFVSTPNAASALALNNLTNPLNGQFSDSFCRCSSCCSNGSNGQANSNGNGNGGGVSSFASPQQLQDNHNYNLTPRHTSHRNHNHQNGHHHHQAQFHHHQFNSPHAPNGQVNANNHGEFNQEQIDRDDHLHGHHHGNLGGGGGGGGVHGVHGGAPGHHSQFHLNTDHSFTSGTSVPSSYHSKVEASNALKSILNAAYQVEINMKSTSSLLRIVWEKIKCIVTASWLWAHQPIIDMEWKIRVASDILDSLSESRLAKSICAQFRERLKQSHDNFLSAIKQLESVHSLRLERTEEHRIKVRKVYAPKIARYALESTSLKDLILYGMPQLGREIGRGQYGVVYSCDSWAGYSPVALKSVVPPDDKHWNDLAMEFYYTRSIPDHERIVQIRGSVIDHTYAGGSTPAVLLIMDRLTRDLYSAIKNGLDLISRLQVAIDVVQGIRFLHSQGLVHRDIKLKNVLLDKRNRAKITDLGFCKPEAMMSGSIVGTPIHMAPELFSGRYDSSVDVYAFGILFWYICAGTVRLPYIFEQCQNKDQLWTCVRKGKPIFSRPFSSSSTRVSCVLHLSPPFLRHMSDRGSFLTMLNLLSALSGSRPERLPVFDDDCWNIMERCWAGDPSQRPLLGEVEPKLVAILEKYKSAKPIPSYLRSYPNSSSTSNPKFLRRMTQRNDSPCHPLPPTTQTASPPSAQCVPAFMDAH